MTFSPVDERALARLELLGVGIRRDLVADSFNLMRITFSEQLKDSISFDEIADGLEAAERLCAYGAKTTVWFDIRNHNIYTHLAAKAIEKLRYFGLGLFVSYEGMVSHNPGNLLPSELRSQIYDACYRGRIWHPYALSFVLGKNNGTPDENSL